MVDCGYYDLCISSECPNLEETIEKAFELGWSTVAVETRVKQSLLEASTRTKSNAERKECPAPTVAKQLQEKLAASTHRNRRILSRLTVEMVNAQVALPLRNLDVVRDYDLLAVLPISTQAFQAACTSLVVDIVVIDTNQPHEAVLHHNSYPVGAARGLTFELQYSDLLTDTKRRVHLLSAAFSLISRGGGKNLILSSGGKHCNELRTPYDVMALAGLFRPKGKNPAFAKLVITKNCFVAISHSDARHLGRACMISMVPGDEEKEANRQYLECKKIIQDTMRQYETT